MKKEKTYFLGRINEYFFKAIDSLPKEEQKIPFSELVVTKYGKNYDELMERGSILKRIAHPSWEKFVQTYTILGCLDKVIFCLLYTEAVRRYKDKVLGDIPEHIELCLRVLEEPIRHNFSDVVIPILFTRKFFDVRQKSKIYDYVFDWLFLSITHIVEDGQIIRKAVYKKTFSDICLEYGIIESYAEELIRAIPNKELLILLEKEMY